MIRYTLPNFLFHYLVLNSYYYCRLRFIPLRPITFCNIKYNRYIWLENRKQ